jgi:hypothetical protein
MRSWAGVGGVFSWCVRAARLLTASFGFLHLVAACSGEDDGAGKGTSVDAGAAKPLLDAICSMARNCCLAADFPAGPLSDCEPEMLRQSDWLTAIANGTVELHEPEFSQCIDLYEGLATSCVFDDAAFAPCRLATTGKSPSGGPCEDAIECLRTNEPVVCASERDGGTGTCSTLVRGTSGQSCILTGGEGFYGVTYGSDSIVLPLAYCDTGDGLICEYDIGGGTCVPAPGAGAACSLDCAAGFSCVNDVCEMPSPDGSTCETSGECQSQYCGPTGVCEERGVATDKLCGGDYN